MPLMDLDFTQRTPQGKHFIQIKFIKLKKTPLFEHKKMLQNVRSGSVKPPFISLLTKGNIQLLKEVYTDEIN